MATPASAVSNTIREFPVNGSPRNLIVGPDGNIWFTEMIVAFARENKLATIIGENTAGRLLSATSVKVGNGFNSTAF